MNLFNAHCGTRYRWCLSQVRYINQKTKGLLLDPQTPSIFLRGFALWI